MTTFWPIIEVIWWTGLAPWEVEFPFPGSLISTLLEMTQSLRIVIRSDLTAASIYDKNSIGPSFRIFDKFVPSGVLQ